MREITCGDGMRWRIEAMAAAATDGDGTAAGDAELPQRVALLSCVTCEGEPRHVTIRAPADEWRELSSDDLCRLIAEAEAVEA